VGFLSAQRTIHFAGRLRGRGTGAAWCPRSFTLGSLISVGPRLFLSRITVGAPETGRIDFSLSFSSAERVACFAYALTVTSRIPGSSLPRGSRSCDRVASDYMTRNPTAHFRIGRSIGNDEWSGHHLHMYSRPIELAARKSSRTIVLDIVLNNEININFFFIGSMQFSCIVLEIILI